MSEPSGKQPAEIPEGQVATGKDAIRAALQGVQIDDDDASGADAKHLFWDTQPVPGLSEDFPEDGRMGPIDHTDLAAVRKEPYTLPASFQWTDVNLDSDVECKELYTLLHENYVEDGDQMFRFDYSMPFLRWALQPPGYRPEWFVGVRVAQTQKLVAFIACTPALLYCHGTRVQPSQPEAKEDEATSSDDEPSVVEVNFLCVHKKLRSKRLAPVLIKEITRRVNVCGIFQARRPSPRFLRAPCLPARPPAAADRRAPPCFCAGGVHGGDRAAEAGGALPVLAPLAQPEEADRGRLLASGAADDDDAHRQAVRAARGAVDARAAADGRRRLRGGVRRAQQAPDEVRDRTAAQRGDGPPLPPLPPPPPTTTTSTNTTTTASRPSSSTGCCRAPT